MLTGPRLLTIYCMVWVYESKYSLVDVILTILFYRDTLEEFQLNENLRDTLLPKWPTH